MKEHETCSLFLFGFSILSHHFVVQVCEKNPNICNVNSFLDSRSFGPFEKNPGFSGPFEKTPGFSGPFEKHPGFSGPFEKYPGFYAKIHEETEVYPGFARCLRLRRAR